MYDAHRISYLTYGPILEYQIWYPIQGVRFSGVWGISGCDVEVVNGDLSVLSLLYRIIPYERYVVTVS